MAELLAVRDLRVDFVTDRGVARVLDAMSLSIGPGEVVGLVGESGCGKTTLGRAILGILPPNAARVRGGQVLFKGRDLLREPPAVLNAEIRGAAITFIPQDPYGSFNPVFAVGTQVMELMKWKSPRRDGIRGRWPDLLRAYSRRRYRADREAVVELLRAVQIPEPERALRRLPHEFSGGQRQRLMIAMALLPQPDLIIADEPTTALDVTIQAQILRQLKQLRDETGAAVIMVTHDLGVVADVADRVMVMYGGRVVEKGTLDEIFYDPQHPYTWGLLGSIARVDRERPRRLPAIPGTPPSLLDPPAGCHFRPRCPHAFDKCTQVPALEARVPQAPAHLDRCWLPVEDKRERRQVAGQIGLVAGESVIA
jgi:oligopeptide/dipeptide ABC transporter ATP-binding protein